MKRITIFGGTFDPPHLGHIQLAAAVVSAKLADLTLFVPAAAPTHKTGQKISDFDTRLAMLRLALAGRSDCEISEIELSLPRPSYTIQTMEALEKIYPDAILSLLIGGDSLAQLHTWHDAQRLIDKWPLIIYPRKGEVPMEKDLERQWSPHTSQLLLKQVVDLPEFEISSTEIRNRLAKNDFSDNFIDSKVLEYIIENGIYQQEKGVPDH